MAEYPYQTYARLVGRNWPGMAELKTLYGQIGITAPVGSAAGNVALQKALLGGWRPGQIVGAAAPAPAPAPAAPAPAAPAPTGYPSSLFIDPGSYMNLQDKLIAAQKYATDLQATIDRENLKQQRYTTEAQLSANPADFVAYELYKRKLQEQGLAPQTGAVRSDADIQAMFNSIIGAAPEVSAGIGQFGVNIPTTQSVSRSQFQTFDPTDLAILSSFLKGGVQQGGTRVGINPEDYFQKLQEGFIPYVNTGATQYSF